MAGSQKAGEGGSPSHFGGWRLLCPAPALRTMAFLRLPALPGPRARRDFCYGLRAGRGLGRRVTSRYEPKIQAFGLESKACSGYGWEFFLASFGAFLLSLEPLRRNSNRNFREIFRGNFELRRILSFSFRSGISRSEIEKNSQPRTTKGFDSVRVGTRITTNDDVSLVSFSNSSNRSVFFRSEKAEDF